MKTALIQTSFWKDTKIFQLNIDTKLLYLFYSSNPERNTTRYYLCPDRLTSVLVGISNEALAVCKRQLQELKLLFFHEDWVCLGDETYVKPSRGKLTQKIHEQDLLNVPSEIVDRFNDFLRSDSGATQEYKDNNKDKYKDNNNLFELEKIEKPKNEIWDAVTEAFGLSKAEITRSLASQLGKVVKDLKDVNATPEEIFKRYRNYKVLHPNWELTPFALVKHWAAITDSHVEKLLDITRKSRDREIDTYTEDQMLTDIVQKAYDENQAKQLEEKRRRETKRVLETEQAMRILEEGRK